MEAGSAKQKMTREKRARGRCDEEQRKGYEHPFLDLSHFMAREWPEIDCPPNKENLPPAGLGQRTPATEVGNGGILPCQQVPLRQDFLAHRGFCFHILKLHPFRLSPYKIYIRTLILGGRICFSESARRLPLVVVDVVVLATSSDPPRIL